ncbi:amidohydrolase family protein [Candidatus Poribacteria bacterium]|nr:amidohydrolase family protein [Candidatus Poribacteria bacterium]
MIIDSHIHITHTEPIENLLEHADISGVEKLIVSSLGVRGYISYPTVEEVRGANDLVIDAVNSFPDRVIGICYVNPRHYQESQEELKRCIAGGPMVGIKLWIAAKASEICVEPIAEKAVELDVPILQHAWNKTTGNMEDESNTEDVAELARKYPELRLHMAHLYGAGFNGIARIAPYPNIYVDTGGGEPEAGILEHAVKNLGAERILFGSDAPGRGFDVQLGKVLGADIPEQTKQKILHINTAKVYKL